MTPPDPLPISGVQVLSINSAPDSSGNPLEVTARLNETATTESTNDRKRTKRAPLQNVLSLEMGTNASAHEELRTARQDQQSAGAIAWSINDDGQEDGEEDIADDVSLVDVTDIVEVEEDEPDGVRLPNGAGKLSKDEILNTINDQIAHFTEQWRPGKGHDRRYVTDPVEVWRAAEVTKDRSRRRDIHFANIKDFENRLDLIAEELYTQEWNTREELQRMCVHLEGKVNCLEETKWLADIYACETVEDVRDVDYKDDEHNEDEDDDMEDVDHMDETHEVHNAGVQDLHSSVHNVVVEDSTVRPAQPTEIIDLGSESEPEPESEDVEIIGTQSVSAPLVTLAPTANVGRVGAPAPSTRRSPIEQEAINSVWTRSDPELASIHAVAQWDLDNLIAQLDRKRIVMKVIYKLSSADREMIRKRFNAVKKRDMLMEVLPCVNMMIQGESKIRGVLPNDTHKVIAFTKLFFCWWLAGDFWQRTPAKRHLQDLADSLRTGVTDLDIFYDWVVHIFANTFSEEALSQPPRPSQAEIIVISDDDD